MKIPLNAVYYFEAAARLCSYSEAARELHVSHGAVLAQVQKLEGWLNTKLFVRHKGRILLTEDGQTLSDDIGCALQQLENALARTRSIRRQTLIISTIPSLAAYFLLPAISELHHRYPDIDLDLHYCMDGQYHPESHLVLCYRDNGAPEKNHCHKLFSGETVPVCGQNYLATPTHALLPHEIAAHPLLHDLDRSAWQHWFAEHAPALTAGGFLRHGTVYHDFNLLYTAVSSGNGIALCPRILLQEKIRKKKLIKLSDLPGNRTRAYYLLIKKAGRVHWHEPVIEWILQRAAHMAGSSDAQAP